MNFQDIRATHDIQSILGTRRRKIVCPLPGHAHHNHTPSFSIFWKGGTQYWKCHGHCGLSGDVIDLVGYLRIPGYDPRDREMRERAARMVDSRFEISIPIARKEPRLGGSEWFSYLPPQEAVISYARGRGLSEATLLEFSVGQARDPMGVPGVFMTMPCFEDRLLVGIKMRSTGDGLRFVSLKGSRQGLFNMDRVAYHQGTVFVVKGEIPCMLLHQMGYKACAPTGGEGGWVESWRTALALSRNVVVGDNDDPGRALGRKRALLLGARLVFPPERFKDIDDFIRAEPGEARRVLEEWNRQA